MSKLLIKSNAANLENLAILCISMFSSRITFHLLVEKKNSTKQPQLKLLFLACSGAFYQIASSSSVDSGVLLNAGV